jgi:signal transduction histidine kinase
MGDIRLAVKPDDGQNADARIVFEISDTGIGIPASLRHSIFQVFVQGDGSLNRRRGGAGIGLTLCARLVEEMGGSLRVHSTPGVGSTFWFSVALPPAAAQPAAVMPQRLRSVPA